MPSTSRTSDPASSTTPFFSSSPFQKHKYYRLPRPAHDVQLTLFDGQAPLKHTDKVKSLLPKLLALRNIFAQEEISVLDIHQLMLGAYFLLVYASQWGPTDFEDETPSRVVEAAARRFLVTDAVYCIIQLLGSAMNREQWWDRFMAHVEIPESAAEYPSRSGKTDWRLLVSKFRDAIQLYGQGIRPAPSVVVDLKRSIFCDPKFPPPFRHSAWDFWRKDDDDFKRTAKSR